MSSRSQILSLYKQLIKESTKFSSYNFREHAKLRIHHEFALNKQVEDPAKVQSLIQKAEENLASLKRQVIISQLFPSDKNILG